mgnify:CR=1 FL=1
MDRIALALNHTNRMHNMPVADVKDSLKLFLLWLCKDEHYAYGIIRHFRESGVTGITVVRLYPLLKEMESDGLLRSLLIKVNNRKRRIYRATKEGSRLLLRIKSQIIGVRKDFFRFLVG